MIPLTVMTIVNLPIQAICLMALIQVAAHSYTTG
jgi:hypothetical protein